MSILVNCKRMVRDIISLEACSAVALWVLAKNGFSEWGWM